MPYCGECREPFRSQSLFDAHRVGAFNRDEEGRVLERTGLPVGPRRCLTKDEMRAKGWRFDGRTWRGRGRDDDIEGWSGDD